MHPRILYFDIDGVLLDYEDRPKPALVGGVLQSELQRLDFRKLVCVSGWANTAFEPGLRLAPAQRVRWIYRPLKDIFPDEAWFCARTDLYAESDKRGFAINLAANWYCVDDWADKFTAESYGEALYKAELGRRISRPDPYGDGSDILAWLSRIPLIDDR